METFLPSRSLQIESLSMKNGAENKKAAPPGTACCLLIYEPSGLNGLGLGFARGESESGLEGAAGLKGLGLALPLEPPALAGFMGLNGFASEDDSGDGAELAELMAK